METIRRDWDLDRQLHEKGWLSIHLGSDDVKNDVPGCLGVIKGTLDIPHYRAIDLFAGIGGIRMGFEDAFTRSYPLNGRMFDVCHLIVVLTCEINERARTTYFANFPPNMTIDDVNKINAETLKNIGFDVCLAGFPCQAFSQAGRREGLNDRKGRGRLFYEVARICAKETRPKPKVIFCENVKGLKAMEHGKTLGGMVEELRSDGYRDPFVEIRNSRSFGVPQNRERLYMVAFRSNVDCSDFKIPESYGSEKRLGDILEKGPLDEHYYISQQYLDTLERHRKHHESLNHGFGYVVRSENDVAGAVMCGGMGRERNMVYDPSTVLEGKNRGGRPYNDKHYRFMTPREWARLQGFPDDFRFPVAKTYQYAQLGNSVTVTAIRAIANEIRDVLDSCVKRRSPPLRRRHPNPLRN